jgi:hypothetical protein
MPIDWVTFPEHLGRDGCRQFIEPPGFFSIATGLLDLGCIAEARQIGGMPLFLPNRPSEDRLRQLVVADGLIQVPLPLEQAGPDHQSHGEVGMAFAYDCLRQLDDPAGDCDRLPKASLVAQLHGLLISDN